MPEVKLNIYIAGPMRGHPDLNRRSFHDAESYLNSKNIYITHNPAKWDEELDISIEDLYGKAELSKALRRDLDAIFECDCMFMLRGWEKSDGAKLEHGLATMIGLTIIYQT